MKVLEKKLGDNIRITYDPKLDNMQVPKIVEEKMERAREFLNKHPIPEHLLKR